MVPLLYINYCGTLSYNKWLMGSSHVDYSVKWVCRKEIHLYLNPSVDQSGLIHAPFIIST